MFLLSLSTYQCQKRNWNKTIYAVIGGFHLPADGGIYEAAIESTLYELQKADPKYIILCHCTGWKATNRIIEAMPEKFLKRCRTTFSFKDNPLDTRGYKNYVILVLYEITI